MNNSEFLKVKFLYGNNERYDYYILAERQEIEISENELVFKVSNLSKTNIVYSVILLLAFGIGSFEERII